MGESALGNNSPITMNLGTECLITETFTKGNRKNVERIWSIATGRRVRGELLARVPRPKLYWSWLN